MNTIKIFENEQFGKVRIAMSENNEPFFCLADVCQILDLIPSKVAQRLDKDVLSKYPLETAGGIQQANFESTSLSNVCMIQYWIVVSLKLKSSANG